jgi:antitoxin component of RelBE/YafQ-DinJ toxin-antitoxin module
MAQKFVGFKPETIQKKILPALGYNGPTDQKSINLFLAANPAAAAKMGKYTMAARQMVEGKRIGAANGYTTKGKTPSGKDGGWTRADLGIGGGPNTVAGASRVVSNIINQATAPRTVQTLGQDIFGRPASDPTPSPPPAPVYTAPVVQATPTVASSPTTNNIKYNPTQVVYGPDGTMYGSPAAAVNAGVTNYTATPPTGVTTTTGGTSGGSTVNRANTMPSGSLLTQQIGNDPNAMVSRANVVAADGGPAALIPQGTGQAGQATQGQVTTAGQASTAASPNALTPAQMQAAQSRGDLEQALQNYLAAQGQVNPNSIVDPELMDPMTAAALQLQAAQQGQAQTVQAPSDLQVAPDQLVDGSAVNMSQVETELAKSDAASVRDELGDLMKDFEGERTPSWAAGAMRTANAAMAQRGLSSSSIAGMAITQAAMEAALPIAQIDTANKQQMAMLKAEQRASFMGMEFDQEFQAKVRNAARIAEIANVNFTAEQAIALENAKMAQTVDLANLSNRQAKVIADASILSQLDLSNLNNRQQSAVQNAQSFLAMDMSNLDNAQQMSLLKAQELSQSILSDTAAVNASRQFNAASENQTNQFFESLSAQVGQFNAEQINAINRFNAGETNALEQFNVAQDNARDQFNAQNHLIIAQANAQWAQAITTAANAAANQANRDAALVSNNLTTTAYNNAIQRERDLLAWAWQAGENQGDRDRHIAVAQISANGESETILENAAGSFVGEIVSGAAKIILGNWD